MGCRRKCSCSHLHEQPSPAPSWQRAVSAATYLFVFVLSLAALFTEFALEHQEDHIPPVVSVIVFGWSQYMVECLLAYGGIVTLWSWKPYFVLQHHLTAVILCITLNLQLFADPSLWLDLLQTNLSLRLVFVSCGFTGVNEGLWVLSSWATNPKVRWLAWARVCCGMLCLIQNIIVCVPCLLIFCIETLWPLFKDTGSGIALFQIVVNGIIEITAFHFGLQGSFLRKQLKLMRRLCRESKEDTRTHVVGIVPTATVGWPEESIGKEPSDNPPAIQKAAPSS